MEKKAEYQVLARKYRPKTFKEVYGQDSIVTTLKNAIKFKRIAHAYLFCGSRGTGKTTLARVFAKALNCMQLTDDFEPCNVCACCKEISQGISLDILEVDGASNRGIDDVRQITETASYTPASGRYRIYIIDEVHMLTKEAFNALLKTLEEPPAHVKFFFATTEPHKVLPTILSRCQRFNLNRIPTEKIIAKLQSIATDLKIDVQVSALRLIAKMADGGLRDAESLFDQIIAFHDGPITVDAISIILGLMPKDAFYDLDQAGWNQDLSRAFEIAQTVFSEGKDITHFTDGLIEHYRTLLLMKLAGKGAPFLLLSDEEKQRYAMMAENGSKELYLHIIDFLLEAQTKIRFAPSPKIALEALLMRVIRSYHRISIESLITRLIDLEKSLVQNMNSVLPNPNRSHAGLPLEQTELQVQQVQQNSGIADPTSLSASIVIERHAPDKPNYAVEMGTHLSDEALNEIKKKKSRYETVLQFASIELEGKIQRKSLRTH